LAVRSFSWLVEISKIHRVTGAESLAAFDSEKLPTAKQQGQMQRLAEFWLAPESTGLESSRPSKHWTRKIFSWIKPTKEIFVGNQGRR
jgi:hypothetical protein